MSMSYSSIQEDNGPMNILNTKKLHPVPKNCISCGV